VFFREQLEAKLGGIVMQRFKEVHARMVAEEKLPAGEKLKNRLHGLCLLVDTYNDLRAEQATKDKMNRMHPKYVTAYLSRATISYVFGGQPCPSRPQMSVHD
jgi:hypothetical protein